MTNIRKPPEAYQIDYRWLAGQCRQAVSRASTENERADLRARAKTWDFLADHCPHRHRPALNEEVSYQRQVEEESVARRICHEPD
jgi:hypothetical protein